MTTIERSTTDAPATLRRPPGRRIRWLAGLGWVLLLAVSVDIVLVVSRYLTFDPEAYFPEQREVYLRLESVLGVHVLSGILALLTAPFQLLGSLRRRLPRVHRVLGGVYVASVLALGLTGLVLAPTAYTGLVAVLGFTFLDAALLYTTWTAVRKVVAGEIEEHRRWILRSYALILAGVTLRLMTFTHAVLVATGLTHLSFETAYAAISWLCWVPNLLVALWVTRRPARKERPSDGGRASASVLSSPVVVRGTKVGPAGPPVASGRLDRAANRLRRVPPLWVDAGVAVLFLALEAAELARQRPPGGGRMLGAAAALTLVLAACIVVRRRVPLAAYVIATAALVAEAFLQVATMFSPLATLVGAYALGRYATPRAGPVGTPAHRPGRRRLLPGYARSRPDRPGPARLRAAGLAGRLGSRVHLGATPAGAGPRAAGGGATGGRRGPHPHVARAA